MGRIDFYQSFQAVMALIHHSFPSSTQAAGVSPCSASAFSSLSLGSDIRIQSLDATAHHGLAVPNASSLNLPPTTRLQVSSTDICLLTISYTHPGEGDFVTTWVGLPLSQLSWNNRFLMYGGGGWRTGNQDRVVSGVGSGYSSASTNAGHDGDSDTMPTWALREDGSVNWPAVENFGSRATVEAVRFGKSVTELYFGSKPNFSYWNGCSTGGRQGQLLAEKVPDEFSGILAGAPGINWSKFLVSEAWGYVVASEKGLSPPPCVLDALKNAAITACDELDGVKDGVIAFPGLCNFDASSLIGSSIECSDLDANVTITEDLASLAWNIWSGPSIPDGKSFWYGLHHDSDLIGDYGDALLTSNCTTAEDCDLSLFPISQGWIQAFLDQVEPSAAASFSLSREEFYYYFNESVAEFTTVMAGDNANLTPLKQSGAKMLVWHGMADQLIPTNGSIDYRDRVLHQMDTNNEEVDDFYRLFLAPGVAHCGGGPGLDPTSEAFFELVAWVENGTVPEIITGVGPAVGPGNTTATRSIGLCAYPKVLTFNGSDPNNADDFVCV